MDRRRFLINSLALVGGMAARPRLAFSHGKERILVIGAGMAGISAASVLTSRGFDVTVLEARKEIGGRIRQDSTLGVPLDLGGSFITTSVGNPLLPLAKRFGAVTYDTDLDDAGYVDASGKFLAEKFVAQAGDRYDEIRQNIDEIGSDLDRDKPVQEVLTELIGALEERDGSGIAELVKFLAVSDISGDYAADPSEYSTRYFQNDGAYSGPDLMVVSGYRKILDGLARGVEVKTGVVVQKIAYGGSRVTVESSAGKFEADRILVTVPLGVLKRGAIEFSPGLPEQKKSAITNLGMGLLDKLYLKFPDSFWRVKDKTLGYFGNITALGGTEYPDFYLLDRALGQPIVLLFSGAGQARNFEQLSPETLTERAMTTLRRVYGATIPNPVGSIRTSWGTDQFAYGSYSFALVGSRPGDYGALAEPIGSRVFFAGEATEQTYSASVHGAYLSGLREADRITAILNE